MARSLRIEYPGAVYHVLNRGNYRKNVFATPETKQSFENSLFQACSRYGWRLYAYCTLSNHYHLALETPEANLSMGMQWLQSTFANRFNRFHQARGHLFQGRFKSLIVEQDEYLGPLIHYIHLNPIRAGLVSMKDAGTYRWSSLWYLDQKRKRPDFMALNLGLYYAGGLADTVPGRRAYRVYLSWLQEEDRAKRELGFSKMCRGWALGSKRFKEALVEKYLPVGNVQHLEGKDLQEANQIRWEVMVKRCMQALRKTRSDIEADAKAAEWKVLIAHFLKSHTSVSNVWLANRLRMGAPQGVSRSVSAFDKRKPQKQRQYRKMIKITT